VGRGGTDYDIAVALFATLLATPELQINAPTSAAALAALISKRGINRFCGPIWDAQEQVDKDD
jgi:hypothetical protein